MEILTASELVGSHGCARLAVLGFLKTWHALLGTCTTNASCLQVLEKYQRSTVCHVLSFHHI